METIVVTGATGNIGRGLVARLRAKGETVRAVARSATSLEPLVAAGAEAWSGDLGSSTFLSEAFTGVDAAFVMVPPRLDAVDFLRDQRSVARILVDALKDARVPRLVVLSSVGAEIPSGTGPIEVLHDFEAWLGRAGAESLTVLRPTYFMENHLASIPSIRPMGVMTGGILPDLSLPMIATKDVAEAAARALTEPTAKGKVVRYLLGPREYTHAQAATMLGAAIGKPDLRYVQVPPEPLREALLAAGLSASTVAAFFAMDRAMEDGRLLENVRRNAESTTPTTLEEFARETFAPAYHASA